MQTCSSAAIANIEPQASNTASPQGRKVSSGHRRIRSPQELRELIPLAQADELRVQEHRRQVRDILEAKDQRLLVVVGPCSIHNLEGAYEYGRKLQGLAEQVSDRLLLVMRAYFEKPRTTVGWKGLVADPHLDGSNDMDYGLEQARRLLAELCGLGLPLATEALSPLVAEYLQDYISWTAIGARTTESQTHREMASGLESVVGFKNATDGGLQVAIDAMRSAASPHEYLGIDASGQVAIRQTAGNSASHVVLRGAKGAPNYDVVSVARCRNALQAAGLSPRIMVDCSHDNSNKDYRRQPEVLKAVLEQIQAGDQSLFAVMLESHLKEGKQAVDGNPAALDPHCSITDGCIGWETTEQLIGQLYEGLAR